MGEVLSRNLQTLQVFLAWVVMGKHKQTSPKQDSTADAPGLALIMCLQAHKAAPALLLALPTPTNQEGASAEQEQQSAA